MIINKENTNIIKNSFDEVLQNNINEQDYENV